MTDKTIQDVEDRFLALRKQFTEKQWNNAEILNEKVDELVQYDIALAYRLMQRVKNLQPGAEANKQFNHLKQLMLSEHPELMATHSTSSSTGDRVKEGAKLAVDKFKVSAKKANWQKLLKPFTLFVLIPFVLFAFYQIIWASDRFESRTQLIIKQPDGMSTLDPSLAILSGFGAAAPTNDNELIKAFILSTDMIEYLDAELEIRSHYSDSAWDVFSRLKSDATKEDLHKYYNSMVDIESDDVSGLISIAVQGFEPQFSQQLAETIVKKAEWYINEIGHSLAKEQLAFAQNEHLMVEQRLQKAKGELLAFQRTHDLLDPEAEGAAFQQITYELEGKIASTQAKLSALLSGMSEKAPQVMQLRAELNSLENELFAQRARLSRGAKNGDPDNQSVGQILAKFSDLKINLELALTAYSASQVSLEKSRIEAYRQLKYLVTVETSTLPEEAKYPEVVYNLMLFLAVLLMLFTIGKIISATVNELR
ncbi:lipopolysaccharide biosynthesis protein [Aliiglaciecola sp. 3_MG-2023]|uniref:lipopolysaccharide biosynthesis protein n=1 Tax=Aliiglaciecola sp. 3_MG-2023 TaxID=3062644 RepID=UPI0026E30B63|nr:lipopolysaccharide biosynthesis protein [Aliiglaciecola sp. 3_MG-2023]MDO6691944.1 lipopolysaccharide biosynthesis protein [Aliiglaciecola sp. 3_MG-2023]